MMKISAIALVLFGLCAACTVRTERTVVERPAPPSDVVVTNLPPPPPGTIVAPTD